MVDVKIDISKLKKEKGNINQELIDFLKEKTNAEVTSDGSKVTVKIEDTDVTKKYLRVLLKKFLHKKELTESMRVVSDEEGALKINVRKGEED